MKKIVLFLLFLFACSDPVQIPPTPSYLFSELGAKKEWLEKWHPDLIEINDKQYKHILSEFDVWIYTLKEDRVISIMRKMEFPYSAKEIFASLLLERIDQLNESGFSTTGMIEENGVATQNFYRYNMEIHFLIYRTNNLVGTIITYKEV